MSNDTVNDTTAGTLCLFCLGSGRATGLYGNAGSVLYDACAVCKGTGYQPTTVLDQVNAMYDEVVEERRSRERRVGKRAEQKRAADRVLCPACGRFMSRKSRRCAECRRADSEKLNHAILGLESAGVPREEMQSCLRLSETALNSRLSRMRKAGLDVKRREPGWSSSRRTRKPVSALQPARSDARSSFTGSPMTRVGNGGGRKRPILSNEC